MIIALLHLSDIHLKDGTDPILQRSELIEAVLRSSMNKISACFITVSGDIAFSGSSHEYGLATIFFSSLRQAILSKNPGIAVEIVVLPGNHDCNFREESDIRPILLHSIESNVDHIENDSDIIKQCLEVQRDFFKFAAEPLSSDSTPRLFWERQFKVEGKEVRFKCFNTAWVSQLDEKQGKLSFPVQVLPHPVDNDSADLVVSLLHHPYNWLNPINANLFKKYIESCSDVILTGHQHIPDSYRQIGLTGITTHFIEGAALQEQKSAASGFNILFVDLEAQKYQVRRVELKSERYQPVSEGEWMEFTKNSLRRTGLFENNSVFADYLEDPGVEFTHPFKPIIKLRDLFVYPALKRLPLERKMATSSSEPTNLQSANLVEYLRSHPQLVIIGTSWSGKTSLARILYGDMHAKAKLVPLLIAGREITTVSPNKLKLLVDTHFRDQYSEAALEQYNQLPPDRRALLVDDFHLSRLSREGQRDFFAYVTTFFGTSIVFADDLFRIQQLTENHEDGNPFAKFQHCEISDFGYLLRGKLITKWHILGRETILRENELAAEVDRDEKMVNAVIGKNLLPSYPVITLTILQALESQKGLNTATGSLGQLYEVLITDALSSNSRRETGLGTQYTYISRVAYFLYKRRQARLSRQDLEEINREYFDQYRIHINLSGLISDLERSHVLQKSAGNWVFRYRYCYYYFTAKYYQENLDDVFASAALRAELQHMANTLYNEDHANIIIFFIYLTKNKDVIEQILRNATKIYDEYAPCNLDEDVQFVNQLYKEAPRLILPATNVEDNKNAYRRSKDEADEVVTGVDTSEISYDKSLSDLVKINIAFKNLQVMGQVIRNFSGVLKGDLKRELTRESYLLGLRTLQALLRLTEKNLEEVRTYVSQLLQEHRSFLTSRDLAKTTDEFVIWITGAIAFGIIKRVSQAVGQEDLRQTYQEVLEGGMKHPSFRFIDVAVKLDHFTAFPESEIEELWDTLQKNKNWFSSNLLRNLVGQFFYLYHAEFDLKQRIGDKLGIQTSTPIMLENPDKKQR